MKKSCSLLKPHELQRDQNNDDSTINNGCNGEFSYSINGQQAGPFQYIEGVSTDLGFDVTDLTSISIYILIYIIY